MLESLWTGVLMFLMFALGLFLILIVLVQRGKGGGLVGALGGSGGSSALGTKAADTLTKVTIVTAFLWIVVCCLAVRSVGTGSIIQAGGDRPQQFETDGEDAGAGAGAADETADEAGGEAPPANE